MFSSLTPRSPLPVFPAPPVLQAACLSLCLLLSARQRCLFELGISSGESLPLAACGGWRLWGIN